MLSGMAIAICKLNFTTIVDSLREVIMYLKYQSAIKHYKELMGDEFMHSYNIAEPVKWINATQILSIINDQSILVEPEMLKMPPMVEVNWDTNDTKEFDRLLHRILFEEKFKIH